MCIYVCMSETNAYQRDGVLYVVSCYGTFYEVSFLVI